MSLLQRLFGGERAAASAQRWVVVDVETSGLDVHRDRLLAIAAIALRVDGAATPRIVLADSFEAVLRQAAVPADKGNILLHGIGVGAQRAGAPPAEVLGAFLQWLADAPLIAFHAEFDKAMIYRATRDTLGRTPRNRWVDLEPLADALHPEVGGTALDDWLGAFRHRVRGAPPGGRRHAGHGRVVAAVVAGAARAALHLVPRTAQAGRPAALAGAAIGCVGTSRDTVPGALR